jgi:streptomycin 6-kinase
MMEIPAYFLKNARRQFGQKGPAWVRELPAILAHCQDKWELRDIMPVDELSINLVCLATSEKYGEVILKIPGPTSERFTEMRALQHYAGRHTCTLLEADFNMASMLLQRLVPGHDLWSVSDRQKQLEIGGRLAAILPINLDNTRGFPHYTDWMARAFITTSRDYNPSAEMSALMKAALNLIGETDPDSWPDLLLHGDLHHSNILASGHGHWKVIDPQGVIGARFLEPARFIENHLLRFNVSSFEDNSLEDNSLDENLLDVAVTHFAVQLGEAKHLIAAGVFVLHLLSTCWGLEESYSASVIEQMIVECRSFFNYVKQV